MDLRGNSTIGGKKIATIDDIIRLERRIKELENQQITPSSIEIDEKKNKDNKNK